MRSVTFGMGWQLIKATQNGYLGQSTSDNKANDGPGNYLLLTCMDNLGVYTTTVQEATQCLPRQLAVIRGETFEPYKPEKNHRAIKIKRKTLKSERSVIKSEYLTMHYGRKTKWNDQTVKRLVSHHQQQVNLIMQLKQTPPHRNPFSQ